MVCEVALLITVRSLARSYANPRIQIRTLKQQIATIEMVGWSICAAEILNCACPKWVQRRPFRDVRHMSASPPTTESNWALSARHGRAQSQNWRVSKVPSDQRIDGGDDCLCLAALIPPQISALVEPRDRVIVEHAGE